MKRVITTKLLILCFGFFMISFTACSITSVGIHKGRGGPVIAKSGPPPHAKAHGHRAKHSYYYYPDACVYFDISRNQYFYLNGDIWRMTVSIPNSLHVRLGKHVAIEMDTDKPYTHFYSHKKKYPHGQLKKGKKGKKWVKKGK